MALAYVKEDLKLFISRRNFDRLPHDFRWVMFPYRGRQPPPFEGLRSFEDESSEYDSNERVMSTLPFSTSGKSMEFPNEFRWWFYPLIFLDDLPFSEKYKSIITETSFVIGPLASDGPNFERIDHINPGALEAISKKYTYDVGKIPPMIEIAQIEKYRVITEVKERARELKRGYPEIFGETTESGTDSLVKPKKVTEVDEVKIPKSPKSKSTSPSISLKKRLKKWSPKFSRKTEKES